MLNTFSDDMKDARLINLCQSLMKKVMLRMKGIPKEDENAVLESVSIDEIYSIVLHSIYIMDEKHNDFNDVLMHEYSNESSIDLQEDDETKLVVMGLFHINYPNPFFFLV